MQELRCRRCHKLLARYKKYAELEIKCCRCGCVNYFTVTISGDKPPDHKGRLTTKIFIEL